MGLFVLDLWWSVNGWPHRDGMLMNWREFLSLTAGDRIIVDLLGIAIAGGMFVVPLYAFLTTTVAKSQTARTVAAHNIVHSGFIDRQITRLNSSHYCALRMPSSARQKKIPTSTDADTELATQTE